jgi:hypothetical protein
MSIAIAVAKMIEAHAEALRELTIQRAIDADNAIARLKSENGALYRQMSVLRDELDRVRRASQDNIKDEPIPSDDENDFKAATWAASIAPVPSNELPDRIIPLSVQDEAETGGRPEQGSDGGGPVLAGFIAPQSLQFVTPSDAGEGDHAPVDPAPVADGDIPPKRKNPRGLAGEKSLAKTTQLIEPGDLIGVDVRQCLVHGPKGSWSLDGRVKMARTLDLLKSGDMFGFTHIARVGQWNSPEVARNALLLWVSTLRKHGLDLYSDKFNACLKVL